MSQKEGSFFRRHAVWMATATLMGTVIGAGVLAIPSVIAQSGFLIGAIDIIVIGLAMLLLNLSLGEIVLRTNGHHQLTGYMEKYLGPWGKRLMMFSMIFGIYGALTAYIMGEGETLRTLFGGNPLWYSLLFFVVISLVIYKGVKATGRVALVVISFSVTVIILLSIFSISDINVTNLTSSHPARFLVPYGVILFAFLGTAAIPELREELIKEKQKLKKAIIIGSILPIVIYILFAAVVVGIVGLDGFTLLEPNQQIATVALSIYAHPVIGMLANVFAVLSMLTASLSLGLALREMYQYDYRLSPRAAFALTMVLPFVIGISHLTTFIRVIDVTGTVTGGVAGILIVLAYQKAKRTGERRPEYSLHLPSGFYWILLLLFSGGIVYQLVKTIV